MKAIEIYKKALPADHPNIKKVLSCQEKIFKTNYNFIFNMFTNFSKILKK